MLYNNTEFNYKLEGYEMKHSTKLIIASVLTCASYCAFAGSEQQNTQMLQNQIKQSQSAAMAGIKSNHDALAKSIADNHSQDQAAIQKLQQQLAQVQNDLNTKINKLQANLQSEITQLNQK